MKSAVLFLSFFSFVRDYSIPHAIGISIFHSIATFNNAGFDILGGYRNLLSYQNDVLLNLVTCTLIIFGGIGFLVIMDVIKKRSFRKLTLHSKVVISMSVLLIVLGTVALKLTENITWLERLHSVSARTAGFSTYSLGNFTNAGLFVLILLMFIGASPGSTGGGIKTSTVFVMGNVIRGVIFNRALQCLSKKNLGKCDYAGIRGNIVIFLYCCVFGILDFHTGT